VKGSNAVRGSYVGLCSLRELGEEGDLSRGCLECEGFGYKLGSMSML
jgi:hypothetical protein